MVSKMQFPDVDMDRMMVVHTKDKSSRLTTSGVGTCFAIGAIGKTKKNVYVLGLAHTSHLVSIEYVIESLLAKMNDKTPLRSPPKIEVAGGMRTSEECDTEELAEEVERIAKTYNIVKRTFNLASEDTPPLRMTVSPMGISVDLAIPSSREDGIEIDSVLDVPDRKKLQKEVMEIEQAVSTSETLRYLIAKNPSRDLSPFYDVPDRKAIEKSVEEIRKPFFMKPKKRKKSSAPLKRSEEGHAPKKREKVETKSFKIVSEVTLEP